MGWSVTMVVTGRSSGTRSRARRRTACASVLLSATRVLIAGGQVGGRRDRRRGGHQRQAGVLALGEVDRLPKGFVRVRGAIDGDEDVVEHDALL